MVKIGGSVLTEKNIPFRVNFDMLHRMASEISEVYRVDQVKLVLIHGAGSMGHPLVLSTGIQEGIRVFEQKISFAVVQSWQNFWNYLVTSELQQKGVPAFPVQPSSCAIVRGGKITSMDIEVIKGLLDLAIVPVLYGTPAYDPDRGCSILSGDEIALYLAKRLQADRIVHGTDVDGIYTDDPKKNPDAKLIPIIDESNREFVLKSLRRSGDATGGMWLKALSLIKAAEIGVKSVVVNARKPGRIRDAILGRSVRGTVVLPHIRGQSTF